MIVRPEDQKVCEVIVCILYSCVVLWNLEGMLDSRMSTGPESSMP